MLDSCRIRLAGLHDKNVRWASVLYYEGYLLSKSLKKDFFCSPDFTLYRAKCRDRLTCLSDNTQNWPTFGPKNVGWMLCEMSGPFDRDFRQQKVRNIYDPLHQ